MQPRPQVWGDGIEGVRRADLKILGIKSPGRVHRHPHMSEHRPCYICQAGIDRTQTCDMASALGENPRTALTVRVASAMPAARIIVAVVGCDDDLPILSGSGGAPRNGIKHRTDLGICRLDRRNVFRPGAIRVSCVVDIAKIGECGVWVTEEEIEGYRVRDVDIQFRVSVVRAVVCDSGVNRLPKSPLRVQIVPIHD